MHKKIIIGLAVFFLLAGFAVYAAEKAKEKTETAKSEQQETQKLKGGLIDQLIKAYKADDKKAMDEIITKLEKRREQMKKFAKFERWHQMAHRRMMMRGWGFQQCPNKGGCCGFPSMPMNRNWGPSCGGFKPMPQMGNPGGICPMVPRKGCPMDPNRPVLPPFDKPPASLNNNSLLTDIEEISAWDDDALTIPDIEIAMADDMPADAEW